MNAASTISPTLRERNSGRDCAEGFAITGKLPGSYWTVQDKFRWSGRLLDTPPGVGDDESKATNRSLSVAQCVWERNPASQRVLVLVLR